MKCMQRGTESVNAGSDGYIGGVQYAINMTDASEIIHSSYISEGVHSFFIKLTSQQDPFRKPSSALGTSPNV